MDEIPYVERVYLGWAGPRREPFPVRRGLVAGVAAFASGGLAGIGFFLIENKLTLPGTAIFFGLAGVFGGCFGAIVVALCHSLAARWASGWRMAIVAIMAGCAGGLTGIMAFCMCFLTMPREMADFLFQS